MARTRNLNVIVGADVKPLKRDLDAGAKSVDRFGKSTENAGKRAHRGLSLITPATTAAVVGLGGLAVGVKKVTEAYAASEVSNARLRTQLKASGISYRAHADEIDKVIQKTSKLAALDDEDLQDAFTNIVRSTGKVSQSLKLTGLAADIARAKHIDVAKAGQLVGKVATGNVTALSRYGIQIDKGATSTEALATLQKRFAGQAEAYGKTNAGAGDRFRVAFENLQETIGKKITPTLTNLTNKAAKFVDQMDTGTGAGGRFVDKLKDIRDTITPIAQKIGSTATAIKKFADNHPQVTKLAGAVVAVGVALKGIKFVSSATGFTDLLKAGKTATTTLVKILGRAGASGGAAVSANAAESLAGNIDASVNARKGRIRSALSKVFRSGGSSAGQAASAAGAEAMSDRIDDSLGARRGKFTAAGRGIGGVLGTAVGVAAVAGIGIALTGYLTKLNDQLEKKGGIAGLLGKISNIGEGLANLTPQTRGIVGAAKALTGQGARKAGGGRIPGAPVAADTVPALLSPQEFVVTGDGERTLESMTFPGVLDWLQGAQAPHFREGGRAPRRMATGGRVATAIAAARRAGFSGANLVNMIAIAGRESKYNPNAVNIGPRDHSIGLWQINQLAHKGRYGSDAQLKNPLTNAKAAYALFKAAGLSPWNHAGGPLGGTDVAAARRAVLGVGGSGAVDNRTPLPSQDYVFAGFQAATEGTSLRSFLASALDNVGEPHRLKDTPLRATAAGAGSVAGAPPQVAAMLQRAAKYAGGPYDYGGGHGAFGARGSKGGFDCSGYVSAILGPGVLRSPMAVVQPMASALEPGDGQWVTVGMRGTSGKGAHTMIRIGNQFFESGGGHGAAKVAGWNGSFQHYHPKGFRRGGRIRRMFGGGRAGRGMTGTVRSGRPRRSSGINIQSLLNTIASGSAGSVKAALRKAQTLMADHPTIGRLRAYINAANRRSEGRVSPFGRNGLQSFVALAQAELGRQLANPTLAGDAMEAGFDQQSTDLGNQLAADRATEAQTAGAQGALATSQLQTLYANRATIATQLNRARRSGSKKTVAALQSRLSQADSAILAKRAEIVGFQDAYTAATTPEGGADGTDALTDAIRENTAAQQAHTDALKGVQDELKRQTDFANAVQTSNANTALRALADYVSGQIAGGVTGRRFSAGVGTVAAY